ncbi:flavodoxin family protein [Eupransor demetentiae]|uniref:Includes NAD(P)H:quinone oxidoreductase (WrbA) n=1 Tax=Eupransor demetentiae TaxID=3109584 RepID=A0ABM9N468_9LACO|nr:Multimeric flavodoxin WrbA [Lactobacillaceae bacterium LMG 33000]
MIKNIELDFMAPQHAASTGKTVFLNASQHTDGKTVEMATELLEGKDFEQVNLVDYQIPLLGQGHRGDYDQVFEKLAGAQTLVIGTPVYWLNISAHLKNFLEHTVRSEALAGADLYAIVQGSRPNQDIPVVATYGGLTKLTDRLKLNFVGIASNEDELADLRVKMTTPAQVQ